MALHCKVMSLVFNTLSRFAIAFLPRSKHLLISWLQLPTIVILEPKKIKSVTVSTFPPYICHKVMWLDAMTLLFFFLMLNLKPAFSFSLSPSSRCSLVPLHYLPLEWYQLPIWGCWYFPKKSWLQLVIRPAWHFSLMCLAYKLNKQGDNIQPCHARFLIWNQSIVPCPVLIVASLPSYRFLRRQVRWSDTPISLRIFHSLLWPAQSKALV